jgi:hypothetical protein
MKSYLKTIIASTLIIFSFIPAITFAEETTKKQGSFCTRVSTLQTKLADQVTATEKKVTLREESKTAIIIKKESDVDAKRAESRAKAEGSRAQKWDKMISKAKTSSQKTAVEAYKKAITDAVAVRRSAVDASVKAYREGLAELMKNKTSNVDAALATFKTTIDAALVKAQADCAAGVVDKTVSTVFNKSVSDARATLASSRKTNKSEELKALKKVRDDAFKKAEAEFKSATDKARADLILGLK